MLTDGMVKILIAYTDDCSLSELSRRANMTYCHTTDILRKLLLAGILKKKKEGRQCIIYGLSDDIRKILPTLKILRENLENATKTTSEE